MKIPMVDLKGQYHEIKEEIDAGMLAALGLALISLRGQRARQHAVQP